VARTLGADKPWVEDIGRGTVEAAVALGRDYHMPHAQAAFGATGAN
jgi:hypothetical protein